MVGLFTPFLLAIAILKQVLGSEVFSMIYYCHCDRREAISKSIGEDEIASLHFVSFAMTYHYHYNKLSYKSCHS